MLPDLAARWEKRAFLLVLALAVVLLLYRINAPLVDGMSIKQIFVANKARAIAGPPLVLGNNSFDWLDDTGRRSVLCEECPLYTGLVGIGYFLFGEHDWIGRVLSLLATLAAIWAFHDLMRREFNRRLAFTSATRLLRSGLPMGPCSTGCRWSNTRPAPGRQERNIASIIF